QVWSQVVKTPNTIRPNLFWGEIPRGFTARRAMHDLALDLLEWCRVHGEEPGLDNDQYRENLLTLADLYCHGYELPWDRLFPPGMRRTSLPTYPFAREHYWVAAPAPTPATSTGQVEEVAPDVLMLHACWNAQDITQQVTLPENVRHL